MLTQLWEGAENPGAGRQAAGGRDRGRVNGTGGANRPAAGAQLPGVIVVALDERRGEVVTADGSVVIRPPIFFNRRISSKSSMMGISANPPAAITGIDTAAAILGVRTREVTAPPWAAAS